MKMNGKKVRLKKNIRRALLSLEFVITMSGIAYMAIVLFLWAMGIRIL